MKKFTVVLFLTLGLCLQLSAQIVSTESFDTNPFVPVGWALKPTSNNNAWVRVTTGTNPNVTPHSGAGFARFRSSSTQVANGTQQILVSRLVDYSTRGTQAANLNFWMYRDDLSPTYDSIRVFVSSSDTIDATATYLATIVRNRTYAMPDTQAANGWYQYTFAIPATYTNSTTTRFLLQGTSEYTTAASANMFIDDISFDEFPNTCTGIPNVGTIVNPLPLICGGSGSTTLSLSAPITGVIGLTYTWESAPSSSGPWTSFGTNATMANSGTLTTTTYIRCTVDCSVSSQSYTTPIDSILVSTNPLPTVTVSPSPAPYCAGSAGVSIVASGAVTYSWSPAAGLSATTGDTVFASPAATSSYTVTGIDSAGCAATATVNIPVVNPPNVTMTASPNDTTCSGSTVILNCVQGNTQGLSYLWSDGKTTRRDTIVVTSNATYTVTVTNASGCSATDSISVYALPSQNAGFTYSVNGNTYTFTDTTNGATNWVWSFGDGNGSSSQNPIYTFSQPGTYTVTLYVTGPCKVDTISVQIQVYPLAVNDLVSENGLVCYPNPVNDIVMLQSDIEFVALEVYNLHGERIKRVPVSSKKNASLEVKDLPQGMYYLRAHTAQGIKSISFQKK